MEYQETNLKGLYTIKHNPIGDDRGYFKRVFCEITHEKATGAKFNPIQSNQSLSALKGTLRGLHYQTEPAPEGKIIRCTKGRVFDVAVDVRKGSETFLQYYAAELSPEDHNGLFIPPGFAHGFQTLEDNTEIVYLTSALYSPEYECGVSYKDPAVGIKWPVDITVMSEKNEAFQALSSDFVGI